jgi:hypothetical protein
MFTARQVHQFERGKKIASSEFESMKMLYNIMPELVVKPVAWGSNVGEPDAYFFDIEEEAQGPEQHELTRLRKAIMVQVIPRLLRPLETEGRTLTLLHR